jgi:DNA-binding transcriptional regulator YhcF (GntR family)
MVDRLMRQKGRSGKGPRHVRLYHYVMESEAWQSLSAVERAIYIEIARQYMGSNNGRISYSVRQGAAALRISKATACRALKILVERGFICPTKIGAFSFKIRHATEWRLAEHACDLTNAAASKDFMKWQPPNLGQTVKAASKTAKQASHHYLVN